MSDTATAQLVELPPHPIYAPSSPRFSARCGCGWESHASIFRAFALGDLDRHATEAHGLPLPAEPRDSLAACWAEHHRQGSR